ncbi:NADPH:quinone reductase [Aquabacterium sp. OR-4]|uniref:NADPH:quinone reductase n=1 Tax=Aquabacterium sp. OR-4 TaxID=2978127 RepID=UPI0028C7A2CA|nr:NADPH:quinone reductase [Aquabacterium sp. OR-4]MDT7838571.1 NADPH:quinone reductase [Aquabacterium sp. OR-4]
MHAAWYEAQGPAEQVLRCGWLPVPEPGRGELRIRLRHSGVNPGDVKKRGDAFGYGMAFPRVVPHSDGAGIVDRVGPGVSQARLGQRVWCHGAQRGRPMGTAAQWVVLPAMLAVPLPDSVPLALGACLGIPGLTAHRAVHAAGPVLGRTVLVHGGAGAVGSLAIGLARQAGAQVLATVRRPEAQALARAAGAHAVVCSAGQPVADTAAALRALAPQGVDHVVDVDLAAHLALNQAVLRVGGHIAAYASGDPQPRLPFWPMLFQNLVLHLLGSDDFTPRQRRDAVGALNRLLASGWRGIHIACHLPLEAVVQAHQTVEQASGQGRVLLDMPEDTDA